MEMEMEDLLPEFRLSKTLLYHSGAVRTLSNNMRGVLISGSIDKSVKLYKYSAQTGYIYDKSVDYHNDVIYSSAASSDGNSFFTGGHDAGIICMDAEGNPLNKLQGHSMTVCSLSEQSGKLCSGSWDATARLWDLETGKCICSMGEHSHAVSVLLMPDASTCYTASQDAKIRVWKDGINVTTWDAHEGLISCSNDQIIKVWTLDGKLIQAIPAHNSFIFGLASLGPRSFVSGADDGTVKIWDSEQGDLECIQTIDCPRTVWSVNVNELGDLLVGGEDKCVRVFTKHPFRLADEADRREFEGLVEAKHQGEGQKIEVSKLPSANDIYKIQGSKDAEIKLFNENDVAMAYRWDGAGKLWEKIGEAMLTQPKAASGKKYWTGDRFYPEGEYDHLFEVEIGQSGESRTIPFNDGDNVLIAAEKFLNREKISKDNLEQVTNFIRANSKKYASSTPTAPKSAGVASATGEKSLFPFNEFLKYEAVNVEGPNKKIVEFNAKFAQNPDQEINFLVEKDIANLNKIREVLGNPKGYYASEFNMYQIQLIHDKLMKWPIEYIFPIIDLYRMLLLHPKIQSMLSVYEKGVEIGMQMGTQCELESSPDTLILLSIRCLVNMFIHPQPNYVMKNKWEFVLDCMNKIKESAFANPNIRQALFTLALNYSIMFVKIKNATGAILNLSVIHKTLEHETNNKQNIFRCLISIGNLMLLGGEVREMALGLGLNYMVEEKYNGTDHSDPNADKKYVQAFDQVSAMFN